MFDFQLVSELTDKEKNEVIFFYNLCSSKSIEQHLSWKPLNGNKLTFFFLLVRKNKTLVCFSKIEISKKSIFKFAEVKFGPLCEDVNILLSAIEYLIEYFKSNHYTYFQIQPNLIAGSESEYLESLLSRNKKIKYTYDKFNWSSLRLQISGKSNEEIFSKFSKGHKSSIKSTIKRGVQVKHNNITSDELDALANVFVKMWSHKKIYYSISDFNFFFKQLKENENQIPYKMYLVKNSSSEVIGGVVVVFQGDVARYYSGASDPDCRDISILHIAIWEALINAKDIGCKYFDFWGYNHFVDESDEVFYINRFKKGFGGENIFYTKLIKHKPELPLYVFYKFILYFKKIIKKNVRIWRSN